MDPARGDWESVSTQARSHGQAEIAYARYNTRREKTTLIACAASASFGHDWWARTQTRIGARDRRERK